MSRSGALVVPSASKLRYRPSNLIWNPGLSSDAPTVATSGPGGASPLAAGNVFSAYNAGNVTFIGGMPVFWQALGTNYWQNQANGQTGSGAAPWAWEFDYYGLDLAFAFRNAIGNGSYFWVWVNGQPATAAPQVSTANGANNQYWYRLTWATAAQRRIRVYVAGADFGGISLGPTDTISPTGKPSYSVVLIGDSYVNGTGATNQLTSFPVTVGNMLNVELYQCGIGGTGYVQGTVFGNTTRISPLSTIKPNEIWFMGSINDSAYSSSQVVAAAQAAWASAQAASPNSVIRIYGVQANSGSMSAGNIANNTALKTAAIAAGFNYSDPINESWITGTGHVGALTGSGNADIMIGSDGIHPSQAGHDYYARRIAADYAANLNAGV